LVAVLLSIYRSWIEIQLPISQEKPVMTLFLWIILGWFIGLLANWVMGVKAPRRLIVTWLLSIAGALLGGFLGSAFGLADLWSPDQRSLMIAGGGSLVVLAAYRAVRGCLNSN
jgi:uncharacterized membrane protein YeaQ/YmgE (transglycosylase-associated protein family)